jgi:hypothetical protein
LLQVASRSDYKDSNLACDILNEPEMVLQFPNDTEPGRPIPLDQMANFLRSACAMVVDAGFQPTIGFQTARSLGLDDGSTGYGNARLETLAKLATALAPAFTSRKKSFVAQFHYYPEHCDQKTLPERPRDRKGPSLYAVGEFSTEIHCRWKEVTGPTDNVKDRLNAIKAKGYDYAFLWSAQNGLAYSSWKRDEWSAVKRFTSE